MSGRSYPRWWPAALWTGLAASLIAAVRLLRRLSTHRTPERRYMLRALDADGVPRWISALLVFGAIAVVLVEIALFWPLRVARIVRGGW